MIKIEKLEEWRTFCDILLKELPYFAKIFNLTEGLYE